MTLGGIGLLLENNRANGTGTRGVIFSHSIEKKRSYSHYLPSSEPAGCKSDFQKLSLPGVTVGLEPLPLILFSFRVLFCLYAFFFEFLFEDLEIMREVFFLRTALERPSLRLAPAMLKNSRNLTKARDGQISTVPHCPKVELDVFYHFQIFYQE